MRVTPVGYARYSHLATSLVEVLLMEVVVLVEVLINGDQRRSPWDIRFAADRHWAGSVWLTAYLLSFSNFKNLG